jgi:hypothetical protein
VKEYLKTADFLNEIFKFCYYVVICHRPYKYAKIPGAYLYPNIVANSRRHDELQLLLHFCFDLGKGTATKTVNLCQCKRCLLSDASILCHLATKLHMEMQKLQSFLLGLLESPNFKTMLSSFQ